MVTTLLAREGRVAHGSKQAWVDGADGDFARGSAFALQGASVHAPGPEPTFLFVGPSALRFWLPRADEASAVASAGTDRSVNVLAMCANGQSYAVSAALLERFGFDFDGWVVIAVGRQMIAREWNDEERERRLVQSREIGFTSIRLRDEERALGLNPPVELGWGFWDHRRFYYNNRLGLGPWLPEPLRAVHQPHWEATQPIDFQMARRVFAGLSVGAWERHLALLDRIVRDAEQAGVARVALVETPWLDAYEPAIRPETWEADEATYSRQMTEWCAQRGVPWLTFAREFPCTAGDFVDPRHLGSEKLRERFLQTVVTKLLMEESRE